MRKSISVEQQAEEVRKLRKETGAGVRDCLKALRETNFDKKKAIEWLKEYAGEKKMITYRQELK